MSAVIRFESDTGYGSQFGVLRNPTTLTGDTNVTVSEVTEGIYTGTTSQTGIKHFIVPTGGSGPRKTLISGYVDLDNPDAASGLSRST